MEDRARIWSARVLAPIAFLAAATLLVVLVQRALREDGNSTAQTATAETVAVTTAPPETVANGEEPARRFYRIRVGDTLQAIAERYETTVDELLRLNPGVDPLALTPGQRIRIS
jgi:LysM repeat protein